MANYPKNTVNQQPISQEGDFQKLISHNPNQNEVVEWKIVYNKKKIKHVENLKKSGLLDKTKKITDSIKINPFSPENRFEKLVGNLKGYYSKRINIKHKIVYSVDIDSHTIHIQSMWSHYEDA